MAETPEVMYEKGRHYLLSYTGLTDPVLGMEYFHKAAEAGHIQAQRFLGICYLQGNPPKKNYDEAYKWLTLAARQNDGQAACNLARMYINGFGLSLDWDSAYKLLDMACARELEESKSLKKQMKEALKHHSQNIVKDLAKAEELRRLDYNAHSQRFIQLWEVQQTKEEFYIWLKLELKSITPEQGHRELKAIMNAYYDEQECLYPPK